MNYKLKDYRPYAGAINDEPLCKFHRREGWRPARSIEKRLENATAQLRLEKSLHERRKTRARSEYIAELETYIQAMTTA